MSEKTTNIIPQLKDGQVGVYVCYSKNNHFFVVTDENHTLENLKESFDIDKVLYAIKEATKKHGNN